MKVHHLARALDEIAPLRYAESWDNVGLLVGSGQWPATKVLLTIDLTAAVFREARDAGADVVVAYHPPIFEAVKSFTDAGPGSPLALEAARAGVAVYSPHTALDAAPGGVNDWLAAGLGTGDVRALRYQEDLPETEQCKLVTFCPAETVESLRDALASVGAGRIGDYTHCTFELRGEGTFRGGEGTSPAVGRAGVLERVEEVRLEMVCSERILGLAVTMLRQMHPYEEPPIEIHPLRPRPLRSTGPGRRVVLDRKTDLRVLVDRIKACLGVKQLRVAPAPGAGRRHQTVGLCAGAGGSLLDDAIREGCDLFLTGEMRHHDVLAARAGGCTVVLAGHTNTERGYLRPLRARLAKALPGVEISVSRKDGDPLRVM